jgi:hypothetical protein
MGEPPERRRAPLQEAAGSAAAHRAASPGPPLKRLLDSILRAELVWAFATVAILVALTWRSPWGRRLGELFEGRMVATDIVAPFDLDLPDEVRTAERIEQARRAVDDVYLFDAKAGERLEAELAEALAPGSPQAPADPALAEALRGPRGHEALAELGRIGRELLSEKIVARTDTLPHDRAITVRYFGAPSEVSLRDLSRIITDDQVLTARLLKLVNSSFYGFPQRVATVTGAIVLIGFDAVRNLL